MGAASDNRNAVLIFANIALIAAAMLAAVGWVVGLEYGLQTTLPAQLCLAAMAVAMALRSVFVGKTDNFTIMVAAFVAVSVFKHIL